MNCSSASPIPLGLFWKSLLGGAVWIALLLALWNGIGFEWTLLLAGLPLLAVILAATGCWRRKPIACPVCHHRLPGILFTPRYACQNCHAELQSDDWNSVHCALTGIAVLFFPLLAIFFDLSLWWILLVCVSSLIILLLAGRYYTRVLLADELQDSPREWLLHAFRARIKGWHAFGLLSLFALPLALNDLR